jgi:hypothetical protein
MSTPGLGEGAVARHNSPASLSALLLLRLGTATVRVCGLRRNTTVLPGASSGTVDVNSDQLGRHRLELPHPSTSSLPISIRPSARNAGHRAVLPKAAA